GANVFIALPLALLGFGSSTVHLLARPHLWTMVLVAACAWLIQRDLRQHTRWIWALVPLTVVWTNLHGGWLALVAILGIVSAGSAIETLLGQSSWITVRRYAFLAAACLAASLINPFTWHLHAHMAEYLTVDWIKDLIGEFKSPTFRAENMKQYELILLVSIAASGAALLRRNFVGPLLVLFWAHSSLVSARHIPLFVAISLPFLAEELTRLWTSWTATAKKSSVPGILGALAAESQAGIGRASVWAVLPFIVVASPLLALPWPKDFPPSRFPIKMVEKHAELLVRSRVYAEDQWADYLIYRLSPRQKVFFDGRSDFYGEQISREYCMLMNGTHRWKELMAKYDFNAVLIRPDWPLASLLKEQPGWRVVDDDTKAILFERLPTTPSQPNSTR
ncbi:MAG: hypothetical protein HZB13_14200, partial [Acidobacteria bacterium]|nr:hypothetical protein [Acidobacteriota bacterium]